MSDPEGPTIESPEVALSPEPDEELDWRRPHPITIVAEVLRAARSIIFALVLVQGGLFGFGSLAELVVIGVPLGGAILRWYTTRYALGAESIHHRYGLLVRHKQVLPRANVQNVASKAGILARMTSMVELSISDASADGDINLRLLDKEEADRITTLLRSSMTITSAAATELAPPGTTPAPPTGAPVDVPVAIEPIVAPSLGRLAWAAATGAAVAGYLVPVAIWLGALAMAVVVSYDLLPLSPLASSTLDSLDLRSTLSEPRIELLTIALPLMLVAPLLFNLLGIAVRLAGLGGFRLTAEPDRLRMQAGLITEARFAARRERLQQLRIEAAPFQRWAGIETIRYETADTEVEFNPSPAYSYLDPAADTGRWRDLVPVAIGPVHVEAVPPTQVSPLTVRRRTGRAVFRALFFGLAVGAVVPVMGVALFLALAAFGRWHAVRTHQHLSYAMDDTLLLVRSGVFTRRLQLVRLDKIQLVRSYAGLIQRRFGLASLVVITAGSGALGRVVIPDLSADVAAEFQARLASRARRTPLADTL
ncbi:MAG: PH domain-containing protein [Actinomycetota bacterium]